MTKAGWLLRLPEDYTNCLVAVLATRAMTLDTVVLFVELAVDDGPGRKFARRRSGTST